MTKSLDGITKDLEAISKAVSQLGDRPADEVQGAALTLGREIDGIVAELRGITAKIDMLLDEIEKGIIPAGGKQQ